MVCNDYELVNNMSKIINSDFEAVFDASPDATFVCSPVGQILYANQTAVHRYGYSIKELQQLNISDLGSTDPSEQVAIQLRMSLKSGEMFEWHHQRKDGSDFPVEIFTERITLKGEAVILFRVRDIIRRKSLESELEGKKHLLNRILNTEPGTVYIYDLNEQQHVYLNRNVLTMLDHAAEGIDGIGPELNNNIHPDDLPNIIASNIAWGLASDNEIRSSEYRIINSKGNYVWLISRETPFARNKNGKVSQILGIAHDISCRKSYETLLESQSAVLEMIANGKPLNETLTVLVGLIEANSPGLLGSILLLDQDGVHVRHSAAPSLPAEFVSAIDNQPIGPSAGSCGTAVYRKEAVFVEDIATDSLWASYKETALSHNLRACWSTPILDKNGGVLGTFAIYYQKTGLPTAEHMKLIEFATYIAGLAINRDQIYQSLVAGEERLKLFVQHAPSAIAMFDCEMRYIYYSQRWLQDYGLNGQELTGRSHYEVFNNIPDHWKKAHQRSLAGEGERCDDDTVIHADGTQDSIRWETHPWRTDEGKVGGIIIFTEVITARKQMEASLREREARLKTIIETEPECVKLVDAKGNLLEMNAAGLAMLEAASLQEAQQQSLMKFILPSYHDAFRQLHQRVLKGETGMLEFEVLGLKGTRRWLETHAAPMRNEIGKVTGLLGVTRDITEQKHAEKARNQHTNIIERSLNEIFLFDAETLLFTYTNEGAQRNLGYAMKTLLKMTPLDIKPEFDEPSFRRMIDPLLRREKEMLVFETMHRRADDTVFPVEIHLQLSLEDPPQFLAIVLDITERKQSEERIQRLSKLYKALSEVNQAIVRMDEQAELFPLVCRCAVDFGGMKLAWIGLLDKASGNILPVASQGDEVGYLDSIFVSSHANVPEGRGATGTAMRENRSIIINDYVNDPLTAPWRESALELGWASAAAFPIRREGQPFAVLTVCHALAHAFNEETISLLTEMSADISFALDNFDRETRRLEAEESMRLAASVYETSSEGIIITDVDNQIIAVNPAFAIITGYTQAEVIGKNSSIFKSSHHDEAFYEAMWHDINTTGKWQGEIWDKRKSGDSYPKWMSINTVYNQDGTPQRRVAMFIDVSQKKQADQLIWHQANFDALTELPNRQMFHDLLDRDVKKAHRAGERLALMLLDLDKFKEINDTLGHDTGDILLKEVALRLSSCVRESDTVARLGGDEFAILLTELVGSGDIEHVAQKFLHKLTEPFQLGDQIAYISASIGITLYPEDAGDIETLLKNADQAMYAAKGLGRNRYSYFTPFMQEAVQARVRIANDLRGALAGKQFWIAYQPIVELVTSNINKAEALIRWQHPTRGLISPAEFIPIAEETGLINDIGEWVFRESAQQAKRWRASLRSAFQVSVNKSPVQFHNEDNTYIAWSDYLQQLGLPGQSIAVEITEGLLLDAGTQVTKRLLEFRDAGIQVSLDDFGTGYSSLSYLTKLDIDYLKIDQSFTRHLKPSSEALALCEAIIVMAHKLGMKVIAEGVETEEQKNLLLAAGCDYGQGYLFSRPVPADEFENLLSK